MNLNKNDMEVVLDDFNNTKTFCQISLANIYENAEYGKKSLDLLLNFMQNKVTADRIYSENLKKCLLNESISTYTSNKTYGIKSIGSFSLYEEKKTNMKTVYDQLEIYIQEIIHQYIVLSRKIQDKIIIPLTLLQKDSLKYLDTLRDEIEYSNTRYITARNEQIQAKKNYLRTKNELNEMVEKLSNNEKIFSYPEFELMRLKQKIEKYTNDVSDLYEEMTNKKNELFQSITSRDEMTMAVSIAYQKSEEERIDQIKSSLYNFYSIENQQNEIKESSLFNLKKKIESIHRNNDIQQIIKNRYNPENLHFQGKALKVLDWHWSRQLAKNKNNEKNLDYCDDKNYNKIKNSLNEDKTDKDNAGKSTIELRLLKLFNTDNMDEIIHKNYDKLFETKHERFSFLNFLNGQRSINTEIKIEKIFNILIEMFEQFLTKCMQDNDVNNAKKLMILAATFYKKKEQDIDIVQLKEENSDRKDRKYIQEIINNHPIWKNSAFWEEALLLAIGEELQKFNLSNPWEDLPANSDEEKQYNEYTLTREEAVSRIHNIIFGQMGSFTLSMLEFHVPFDQVGYFIETMCDVHELTEDQRHMLRKNLYDIINKK